MMHRTSLAALAVCLVLGGTVTLKAGPYRVPGSQVKERTELVLKGYEWFRDLEALKREAAQRKKLVFWIQIVGDLDGGL